MLQIKKILAQPQANFATSYLSLSLSTDFMQINCDPGPVGVAMVQSQNCVAFGLV